MKLFLYLFISFTLFNCTNKKENKVQYYKATTDGVFSFLSITQNENRFYGQYEVRLKGNAKEYGKIEGAVLGDTLKGRLNYISYGGSRKVVPFLILKNGLNFKLATGMTSTFMGIPYYVPETIKFSDSNSEFEPIDYTAAKNFGLVKEKEL